jgi:hypothetical protein
MCNSIVPGKSEIVDKNPKWIRLAKQGWVVVM